MTTPALVFPRLLPRGGSGTSPPTVRSLPVIERECATCAWYQVDSNTAYTGRGNCHRHAPQGGSRYYGTSPDVCWPSVYRTDFCGEYLQAPTFETGDPMTAADAQTLAATAGQLNPSAVNAMAARYRNAIKDAAAKGQMRLKFADVSPLRMPISDAERAAAKEKLTALGYAVDADGVSWAPPAT